MGEREYHAGASNFTQHETLGELIKSCGKNEVSGKRFLRLEGSDGCVGVA